MAGKYEQKKRKKRRKYGRVLLCILLPLLCGGLFAAWMVSRLPGFKHIGEHLATHETQTVHQTEPAQTQSQPEESQTKETEPARRIATATIGATGDIVLHDLVIQSGYDEATGSYNFDNIFTWFSKYVSEVDYAAANLEATLCGEDKGHKYSGYPNFNAPDEIVDAAKNAGFDLLLTANNHAYDTSYAGFKRTQQVIAERGLDHVGTRLNKSDPRYIVRDINGIKVGITSYTFLSGYNNAGNYILNGLSLSDDATARINGFHYKDLNTFYMNLGGELQNMKADGAELSVVFMHWGTEYKTVPNESQKKIAQQLCDMGVDVIIGSHPYVAQPVELLTCSTYEGKKTLCLFSAGTAVSNIYGTKNYPVNTEDGVFFTFTLAKYSDGTVLVESADVLPTWVHRYDEDNIRKFQIMTMKTGADWKTEMDLTDEVLIKCQESYDRTMEIVGAGLKTANEWFATNQEAKETALGLR